MLTIDSHQHFWKFDPVRDSWIDETMSVIQRDFTPGDLKPLLLANGIDGCVSVQADQSLEENAFLLAHADQHDFVKGVVGWVDLQSDDIHERLHDYSQFKKMKGFRHVLQGEKQRDFMLRPAFMRGISALHAFGYTYDILIFPDQLKFAEKFIKEFPYQPFVIDHLAKPYIRDRKMDEWKKGILSISKYDNVSCKVSGMVTEADWNAWKNEDFKPYLDVIVEGFGMDRLMYGSDWPVCLVAASYNKMIDVVREYFSTFTKNERDAFFGGNAVRFYNL
ncbi:MAG: amidohydrolase [Marivirga sp.]|nr:amidohydrolase [Marivirga sp.]